MTNLRARLIAVTPKRLDYAALRAKGYAGSEFEAHLESGEFREGAGDYRGALGLYLTAIDLEPTNALAYRRAGELYLRLGHAGEGLAMLNRALRHGDRTAELAAKLGEAAAATGDWRTALAHFNHSLKANPHEAKNFHGRSRAHHALGNLEAAITDLLTAVGLEPKFLAAYYDLARSYAALERGDEAMAALRRVQHSRRWMQKARRDPELRFLRQFPAFWAMMSGKATV